MQMTPQCWLWRPCQVNTVRRDKWMDRRAEVCASVNDVGGKRDSGSDVENHLKLLASVHVKHLKVKRQTFWRYTLNPFTGGELR